MHALRTHLVILAFLVGFGAAARAEPIELKFGHVGAPGSLFALSAEEFATRANAQLAGKAKVVVFGSSQLGKDKELLQKLKLGTVDFALPSTVMSSVVDQFGLFEMPYLVKNRTHMGRIESVVFWQDARAAGRGEGYKVIGVWENGFRHITNNVRPVNVPGDYEGMKLRTPKGKWRVKMFKTYGANPTPMSFSEVFSALQTGTIDGQENPYAQIYSAKFQEVQKYLSITGHVYTPAYVTVGAKRWARAARGCALGPREPARQVQSFVYLKAAELEVDLLGKIKAAGVKVNEADKEAFVAASGPSTRNSARKFPVARSSSSRPGVGQVEFIAATPPQPAPMCARGLGAVTAHGSPLSIRAYPGVNTACRTRRVVLDRRRPADGCDGRGRRRGRRLQKVGRIAGLVRRDRLDHACLADLLRAAWRRSNARISVYQALEAVPPALRLVLFALAELFVFGFFALLAWTGYVVLLVLEGDNLVSLPDVSTQFTQSVIPIGAVLFMVPRR